MKKAKSTVFKIKVSEERIMICDYLGMKALFDPSLVQKDIGFGFMNFNPVILKQYTPTEFSNGTEHVQKKEVLLKFLNYSSKSFSIDDLFKIIRQEFENMECVEFSKKKSYEKFDFEDVIEKAVANVVTYAILGESIDNLKMLEEWLEKSLESKYSVDFTDRDEEDVADKVFARIKSTPNIKNLRNIIESSSISYEDIIKEIVWATIFNAFGGIKSLVLSSLICLLKLKENDKLKIENEADMLFSSKNYIEVLPTLNYINSFFLEVLRMFPPAPSVFGRAIKDFVLNSTSGRFLIKEGAQLNGQIYISQRDAMLFEHPDEFSIHRKQKAYGQINSFGGNISEECSITNHKCIGQQLATDVVKLFIVFYIKCSITPTGVLKYTGRNIGRTIASDKPIHIASFRFNKNEVMELGNEKEIRMQVDDTLLDILRVPD